MYIFSCSDTTISECHLQGAHAGAWESPALPSSLAPQGLFAPLGIGMTAVCMESPSLLGLSSMKQKS